MASPAAACSSFSDTYERWLTCLLAGVTALLALTLACSQFQAGLNSDLLWPQVFAHNLGDPLHPISGWKFGSATFWFPDFVLFLPLYWLCGDSGLNYPLYTAAIYLLLGATMAWALAEAGVPRLRAMLAAFLALDGLLLCQFIPGHAHGLWLIGIPADHGGNLANGFAVLALGLGAARNGQWGRWRSIAIVVVMLLGLLSDALLLFHWIIPLALAFAWAARSTPGLKQVSQGFLYRIALAMGLLLIIRVTLAVTGWFLFYRLVREWPLPALIGQTLSQFFADFFQNGLFTSQWLFWLFMIAAIALFALRGRVWQKETAGTLPGIAAVTASLGLALAWAVTMGALYWHDVMSFRYLLNWVVVPIWLLALWLCLKPNRRRWPPRLAAVVGILGLALSLGKLEANKMVFPSPSGAQVLRDYCLKNNLREGLADYWSEYYLRVVWDFAGPRLSQIREKDFTYFWCNNAFDNFPSAPDGHGLRLSAPQFIVLNGLDRAQLTTWLGGEPLRSEQVGPYEIARLTPGQMSRAAALVTNQTKEVLAGPRANWLETQLPPHL